jgi:hypothetical protein
MVALLATYCTSCDTWVGLLEAGRTLEAERG